jgi:hypothetical protein
MLSPAWALFLDTDGFVSILIFSQSFILTHQSLHSWSPLFYPLQSKKEFVTHIDYNGQAGREAEV